MRPSRSRTRIIAAMLAALVAFAAVPAVATASVAGKSGSASNSSGSEGGGGGAHSLEKAAETARNTGRKIATDLIALGFAIASMVLAFRRDFKEAAGVFAIGLVALLLSTETGVEVLKKTVTTLFG